eukprot:TRINITY_DN349_c0_g1_i2.p1 TRINITY_DN349_c0_g1~~TRINITY_DN349_c0_g1_i2.p1  ORF type:complete len:218 (-),score=26.29 TRINITY_DN349_c0_g1_i2:242-895(-)
MANFNLFSSVMTVMLVVVALCALSMTAVNAQAPDPSWDSGSPCTTDSDCAADGSEFCRVGYCAAYVAEGDWCGGFLPPNSERRCGSAYTCTDFPTDPRLSDDGNGYCRKQCSSDDECSKGQSCNADKVCRAPSTITSSPDISNDEETPEIEKRADVDTESQLESASAAVLVVSDEEVDSETTIRSNMRPLVSASTSDLPESISAPVSTKRALVSSSQ